MTSEISIERPTSLALAEPREERHVHFSGVAGSPMGASCSTAHRRESTPSPRKSKPDPDFRPKRKRSYSFSGPGDGRYGNKRRKRPKMQATKFLPSKFLLGGNITDPLNLGALDETENDNEPGSPRNDENAPASRRIGQVQVRIPRNINDPLNLDGTSDNEEPASDVMQQRKKKRYKKRKRRLSGNDIELGTGETLSCEEPIASTSTAKAPDDTIESPVESLKPLTINTDLVAEGNVAEVKKEASGPLTPSGCKLPPGNSHKQHCVLKKQRSRIENKIVSPVIPQPGGERKRHPSHQRHQQDRPHLSQQNVKPPKKFNPKNEHFQYGNYNKYYGYRNAANADDPRLNYFKREWFEARDVLDVGCNIGHVTLTVARDFNPRRVVGLDIDKKLVTVASKNIKHYMREGDYEEARFPKSMRLLYGPLRPPLRPDGTKSFPHNVKFVHANYVLESNELLETVKPEFDVIMCLSVTKWVHLNWGDGGLKRFFQRSFLNLRPGGRLILEPQAWPSYNKRRKLTSRIFENYKNIRLFPEKFNDYLLHEVGFSTSEKLSTPLHTSRGFQRPIYIYTKGSGSSRPSPREVARNQAKKDRSIPGPSAQPSLMVQVPSKKPCLEDTADEDMEDVNSSVELVLDMASSSKATSMHTEHIKPNIDNTVGQPRQEEGHSKPISSKTSPVQMPDSTGSTEEVNKTVGEEASTTQTSPKQDSVASVGVHALQTSNKNRNVFNSERNELGENRSEEAGTSCSTDKIISDAHNSSRQDKMKDSKKVMESVEASQTVDSNRLNSSRSSLKDNLLNSDRSRRKDSYDNGSSISSINSVTRSNTKSESEKEVDEHSNCTKVSNPGNGSDAISNVAVPKKDHSVDKLKHNSESKLKVMDNTQTKDNKDCDGKIVLSCGVKDQCEPGSSGNIVGSRKRTRDKAFDDDSAEDKDLLSTRGEKDRKRDE